MSSIQKTETGLANNQKAPTGIKGVSSFLNSDAIKKKFAEVLGASANSFIASVLAACNQNGDLKNATTESIYSAALMAATLNLPINPNLGFAYLIPYKMKAGTANEKVECQFQIGAKGFKQLAQRTGLYQRITDAIVYVGQLIKEDPLEGYEFDWSQRKSDVIIGYVSYFRLANGFESTFYMTKDACLKHGLKYSQTYRSKIQWVKESSKWNTEFDAMALKTVTKLNLSKNGPLSVEMQKAIITDQSVIKNNETLDVDYADNEIEQVDKEEERVIALLDDCKNMNDLILIKEQIPSKYEDLYDNKFSELQSKEVA